MKKHLIELMIEAGVKWPDGATCAAQDRGDKTLHFYSNGEPNLPPGAEFWMAHNCDHYMDETIQLELVCRNWHQTIVPREQYEKALSDVASTAEVQTEPEHCEPAMNQSPYTINQLADDYYAKAAEAERLQSTADRTLKLAEEALSVLQKAGELLGLVISVGDFQKYTEQHQQPVITDWRDLRVGDVILCVSQGHNPIDRLNWVVGEECEVVELEEHGNCDQPIEARFKNGEEWWIGEFRFIRRPSKE